MLISKEQVRVAKLASSDGSRPVLQQVKVYKHDGKVVTVATDSYVLGEVIEDTPSIDDFPTLPDGQGYKPTSEVLVPAAVLLELGKKLKVKNVLPVLGYGLVEKGRVVTTDLDVNTALSFHEIEGKYPDYRRLIDDYAGKKEVSITLNPKILAKALALFGNDSSIELTLHLQDDGSAAKLDPVILTSENAGTKKTAVVMPLKS